MLVRAEMALVQSSTADPGQPGVLDAAIRLAKAKVLIQPLTHLRTGFVGGSATPGQTRPKPRSKVCWPAWTPRNSRTMTTAPRG